MRMKINLFLNPKSLKNVLYLPLDSGCLFLQLSSEVVGPVLRSVSVIDQIAGQNISYKVQLVKVMSQGRFI